MASDTVQALPRHPALRYAVALAALVGTFVTTVHLAGPLVGDGWDGVTLAAGGVVTAVLALVARWASWWVRPRTRLSGVVLAGILVGAYGIGTVTQVVINGRPALSNSVEARAYRMSATMRDDLYRMVALDRLLGMEPAEAKANFDAYEPATGELLDINARYAAMGDDELPSLGFGVVRDRLKSAAFFGSQAMEAKGLLVVKNDATLAATVDTNRATFASEILEAGGALRESAALHNIELGPGDEDPRE